MTTRAAMILKVGLLLLACEVCTPSADVSSPTAALADVPWSSESELLAHLQDASAAGSADAAEHEHELKLLRFCISRSWFAAARDLVSRAHARVSAEGTAAESFAPIRDEVSRLLADVKKQADVFGSFAEATYRVQTAGLDEVACAVQWAQNSTTVFVGVKYAVRWSAPGAIEVVDVDVNITTDEFHLNGYGHHSGIRKRYMVDLALFGAIDPTLSSWSAASVGRATATLWKATPGVWARLVKNKDKSRHSFTKWLDMQEKWAIELDNYTQDVRQAAEKKADSSKKKESPPKKKDKDDKEKDKPKKEQTLWQALSFTSIKKRLKKLYKRLPRSYRDRIGTYEDAVRLFGNVCLLFAIVTLVHWAIKLRAEEAADDKQKKGREAVAAAADKRAVASNDDAVAKSAPAAEAQDADTVPFFDAARRGDARSLARLLSSNVNVNATEPKDGNTALHVAVDEGHSAIVEVLLNVSADASKGNDCGLKPIDLAEPNTEVFTLLSKAMPAVDVTKGRRRGLTVVDTQRM